MPLEHGWFRMKVLFFSLLLTEGMMGKQLKTTFFRLFTRTQYLRAMNLLSADSLTPLPATNTVRLLAKDRLKSNFSSI